MDPCPAPEKHKSNLKLVLLSAPPSAGWEDWNHTQANVSYLPTAADSQLQLLTLCEGTATLYLPILVNHLQKSVSTQAQKAALEAAWPQWFTELQTGAAPGSSCWEPGWPHLYSQAIDAWSLGTSSTMFVFSIVREDTYVHGWENSDM